MNDNSFDQDFLGIKGLNWLPWVGNQYRNTKVLLIADSHYDDADGYDWLTKTDATRVFINNQGLNSHDPRYKSRKILTAIEKTISNSEALDYSSRSRFWSNVSYFNIVQRLLPNAKVTPNDNDYDEGWEVALKIIETLRPHICIKFGQRGIGRLGYAVREPFDGWIKENTKDFYFKPYCVNLSKQNFKTKLVFTWHPTGARGYKYGRWHQHITDHYPDLPNLNLF